MKKPLSTVSISILIALSYLIIYGVTILITHKYEKETALAGIYQVLITMPWSLLFIPAFNEAERICRTVGMENVAIYCWFTRWFIPLSAGLNAILVFLLSWRLMVLEERSESKNS